MSKYHKISFTLILVTLLDLRILLIILDFRSFSKSNNLLLACTMFWVPNLMLFAPTDASNLLISLCVGIMTLAISSKSLLCETKLTGFPITRCCSDFAHMRCKRFEYSIHIDASQNSIMINETVDEYRLAIWIPLTYFLLNLDLDLVMRDWIGLVGAL